MSEEMQQKISTIQAKYADELMAKAHVVGLGVGMAKVGGEYTSEMALVVLVDKKVPMEDLAPEDRIPAEIEGVRVDVNEVGVIEAF
jgi:hypothetical protein